MTVYNHKVTLSYADEAGPVQTTTYSENGQNEVGFDGSVPANTTGFLIPLTAAFANIQSLLFYSTVTVVFKTNSDTTPAQTINIAAGQILVWGVGAYNPNPITANITALYVDNAQTTAATVKVRFLLT